MSNPRPINNSSNRWADLLWNVLGTLISALLIFVISSIYFGEKINSIVNAITNPPIEYHISGTVDDKNNIKLPNITVSIIGQKKTTTATDSTGYYKLVTKLSPVTDSIRVQLYDHSKTYQPLKEVYMFTSDEKIKKQIIRNYVLQFR